MHRVKIDVIVALIAWQFEKIEVGLSLVAHHIVIAERWVEAVRWLAGRICAVIGVNVFAEKLTDVGVNRFCRADGVVVIAGSDDVIGLPAFDQRCDICGVGRGIPVVSDDGQGEGGRGR